MSRVVVTLSTYESADISRHVGDYMDAFVGERLQKGTRVLVKPNLLAPATADKAITTHPSIVRAVVEYLADSGCRTQVSDSPAMGTFSKAMKETGIQDALRGLDVDCREFVDSVEVEVGGPFKKILVARDAIETDLVINLPKLKTHSQMLLTLGIKNLFGCIVGFKKPEWHFRTGVDREAFAELLVRIYRAVAPAVTILDGVLAMEGHGPGRAGTPRNLGVLMGSDDAVALDSTVCKMLKVDPGRLLTLKAAAGLGIGDLLPEVVGEIPLISDFKMPEASDLIFGPPLTRGLLRRHMVERPETDLDACKLCGECWKYCPVKAITHDREQVSFDYDKCIRCYCCVEVCPHGALRASEPLLGRLVRRVFNRKH